MIITRTPFRISFAGGGTDLPDFYRVEPGAVVSAAINKYMYIVVNKRFDDTIRVSYSKTETVNNREEIHHPVVKAALELVGITTGIEIVSIADVPAGTGLGSSGSFAVGLLNALYAYRGILKSAEELAKDACHIEMDILGEPGGKQDQYIAAYGGLRYFQFNPDGTVFTDPIIYDVEKGKKLCRQILLLYTGDTRASWSILEEQKVNTSRADKMESLRKMRNMAIDLKNHLNNDAPPDILGEVLHQGWILKKGLASGITTTKIEEYYQKALNAGALGGKISGAGGGGFLLLYCPESKQPQLRKSFDGLTLNEFSLEPEGSKIIYVI